MEEISQSYPESSLESTWQCWQVDSRPGHILVYIRHTLLVPAELESILAVQITPHLGPQHLWTFCLTWPRQSNPRGGPFFKPQLPLLGLWLVPNGKSGRGGTLFYRMENPRGRPPSGHG